MKVKWIKIPIEVLCCHEADDPEDVGTVEMNIKVDDPEVPTYLCRCPKCGKEIIIAFGDFLYEEKG